MGSYVNATKIFTYAWSSSTSTTKQISYNITQNNGVSSSNLCGGSVSGVSGTITCNLTGYSGTAYFIVRNNGVLFDRVSIDISRSVTGDTFSVRDQGFISAIVVGVIIMFGLFSSVGVWVVVTIILILCV